MLGRIQLTLAPIIAVLTLSFAGYGWLQFQTIQIPRKLDEPMERPDPISFPPKLVLHADGSFEVIEFDVDRGRRIPESRHIEPPRLAQTLRELPRWRESNDPSWPNVVQLQVDDGVLWGDFVATVSSVRHITAGEVLVVSDED